MQLTKHTDYAFRILLFLLALPKEKKTTINAIVQRYGISRSHAMKVVNKLSNAGFISTKRGKFGGIALGKKPEEIKLDEVVRLMETSLKPINCQALNCILVQQCKLKSHLAHATNAFLDSLSQTSLADIASDKTAAILLNDT